MSADPSSPPPPATDGPRPLSLADRIALLHTAESRSVEEDGGGEIIASRPPPPSYEASLSQRAAPAPALMSASLSCSTSTEMGDGCADDEAGRAGVIGDLADMLRMSDLALCAPLTSSPSTSQKLRATNRFISSACGRASPSTRTASMWTPEEGTLSAMLCLVCLWGRGRAPPLVAASPAHPHHNH